MVGIVKVNDESVTGTPLANIAVSKLIFAPVVLTLPLKISTLPLVLNLKSVHVPEAAAAAVGAGLTFIVATPADAAPKAVAFNGKVAKIVVNAELVAN